MFRFNLCVALFVAVLVTVTTTAKAEVLVDWTFDDFTPGGSVADGSRLIDSSDNGRDAVARGAMSVVSGPTLYGGSSAVIFRDATGGYGEFVPGFDFGDGGSLAGTSFDFDASTSFTVEVIAQFTADDLPHMMVGRSQTSSDTDWWFRKGSGSVNNAAELLTLDDPGNVGYAAGSTALDGWHHVAMVRDRASGTLKAYVDGVLDGSGDDLSGDLTNPEWSVLIGQLRDGGNPFNGAIDRIRISDAALLPSEFIQPIPEPASVAMLLSISLAALLYHRRRFR